MLLYLYPGACSLADHIALIEADLPYRLMAIDHDKRTADGRDYLTINPRGFVPSLQLDDGSILTENLAILACIADRSGNLLPGGDPGRWRALEALSYMATTIHGGLAPLFRRSSDAEQENGRMAVAKGFAMLDDQMGDEPFLLGPTISIADPYLFWALRAASQFGLVPPPRLRAFHERMTRRASVVRALAEEGLPSPE